MEFVGVVIVWWYKTQTRHLDKYIIGFLELVTNEIDITIYTWSFLHKDECTLWWVSIWTLQLFCVVSSVRQVLFAFCQHQLIYLRFLSTFQFGLCTLWVFLNCLFAFSFVAWVQTTLILIISWLNRVLFEFISL